MRQFAGLDLLPEPVALYDAHGSVLFANCASISAPLPHSLPLQHAKGCPSPAAELVSAPLHSWTELGSSSNSSKAAACGRDGVADDADPRVYSCTAYRAIAEACEPLYVVLRHDITHLIKRHELELCEPREHAKRLHGSVQEMADTVGELRSVLESSKQESQGETASHISALLARFDACVRRFRAISAPPERYPDGAPTSRSAPQVAVHGAAQLSPQHQHQQQPQQQAGKNMKQRKPKVQQQGSADPFSSQAAMPYKRHNSTSELLTEDSTAGKNANSRNSNQLCVRVSHLQDQLLQLQSKHNAVCVHSAELAQENHGLRQQLSQLSASVAASQGHSLYSRHDVEQWLQKMQTPPDRHSEQRGHSGSPVPVNQAAMVAKEEFDLQLRKAQAEAAQVRADYDKYIIGANEGQKGYTAQLHKMQADANMYKDMYAKGHMDAIEQKQQFDAQLHKASTDAAEFKAMYDKGELDAVEQRQQFNAQQRKAQADAAEYKAMYDKGVQDALTQHQAHVRELERAREEAVAMKTRHDAELERARAQAEELSARVAKGEADAVELHQLHERQLAEASARAAEFKARFDKGELDAVEQKQQYDAQLLKAHADAAEYKAMYDKGELDAVEQKQQFDAQLLKANADAAEFKAMYDKGELDAVEQKQQYDTQLLKANADAAEYKAMYDKGELDAVEHKQQFDAQLLKANTDAAEFKAMYDKGELDAVEQKQHYDSRLMKANTDAAEYKAMYDKGELDAVEQKQQYDAQLLKANTDAAEYKAQYDKGEVDAVEQKRILDTLVAEAQTRAQELKALFDKGELDSQTACDLHEQQMRELTEKNTSLEAQAEKERMLAEFAQQTLNREQQQHKDLLSEHEQLLRKQEVLQEELQLALNNYQPKAVIDAGTPADKMLSMTSDLLDGMLPSIQDILFVQSAVLESLDIYQPVNLGKQLLQSPQLDDDVGMALLSQLGPGATPAADAQAAAGEGDASLTLEDFSCKKAATPSKNKSAEASGTQAEEQAEESDLGSLEQGLSLLMSPTFCKEQTTTARCFDASCSGSEQSQPTSIISAPSAIAPAPLPGATMSLQQLQANSLQGNSDAAPAAATSSAGAMCSNLHRRAMRQPPRPSPTSQSLGQGVLSTAEERARFRNGQSYSRRSLQLEPEAVRAYQAQQRQQATDEDGCSQEGQGSLSRQSSGQLTTFTAEEQDQFPTPSAGPIMGEVNAVLASASHWQFDAFKLNDATDGHPLSTLAFYFFHNEGLIQHFNLKAVPLARFLRRIEDGYRDNPYHSKVHAADVLQSMQVILKRGGLLPGYADPLTHMACLLAAVIHDYEHMGCTNDFLINKCDDLAVRYNDRAPLENHHLAAAFMLLKQSGYDFLSGMPKPSFDRLRKLVIELVLATDMKQHFAIVSHFTTIHRLSASESITPSAYSVRERNRCARSESGYSSAGHHSLNSGDNADGAHVVVPLDEAERLLSLQVALKCCDLGHTASALPVHLRWVAALEEEFFRQGDAERKAGMPISPLFDRNKQGISKSQVGFYDIVVIPLFHAFSRVFTRSRPLLTYVMRNYKVWTDQSAAGSSAGQVPNLSASEHKDAGNSHNNNNHSNSGAGAGSAKSGQQ